MPTMAFNDERLEIEYRDKKVPLLAKEYALLRYLHRNANHVFSREQLLDRVWAGEYPVDRTVDDHIYRLRKKLKEIGGPPIETIRGVGYGLTLRPSVDRAAPSLHDPAVQEAMNGVFARYHRLGQGHAMLQLAGQHRELGFELDSFYRLYVHFVEGDLRWFLDTEEVPIEDRFYWLLLFHMCADSPGPKAALCEKALRLRAMHGDGHREMEILNIVDLYASERRIEDALATLELGVRTAAEQGLDGFVIPLEISRLYVQLLAGEAESVLAGQSAKIATLLERETHLRELAGYRMIEGTRLLLAGHAVQGEDVLQEGLDTFERSGFVPHRLLALLRVRSILGKSLPGSRSERKYSAILEAEYERFGLHELLPRLTATIEWYLDRLEL
ncbi:winged helix-turn-helix domain-containing protein [Saccharibacillus sacchari]|uniref:Winged helix-turn-helix domain-containing protein n=1 Tax=Saccharibacillus sacchari TaxID=456493 RepID=A0ACC6PGY6_9BACL